jgi:hypothetical protein
MPEKAQKNPAVTTPGDDTLQSSPTGVALSASASMHGYGYPFYDR